MSGVAPVNPTFQFFDAYGNPLASGTLTVYVAGTTTPTDTWQDRSLTSLNTNPIVLNAAGRCTMWLDPSVTYKFLLKDVNGVTQSGYPVDNVPGSGGSAAIMTFTQSGTGAVTRTAQDKMRDIVSVKDFGAMGDGVTDDTAAIQAAIAASYAIYLPPGNYKISGLTINANYFVMLGAGKYRTNLIMDTSAAVAIQIGSTTNASTLKLQGFSITGNASNLGGISLGTATYYAAFLLLDEVSITSFTNTATGQGYGISLNTCQEIEIRNCYLFGNRNNIYRPVIGYCTSTRITGKSGYIGHATGRGVYIRGYCLDLYIQDGICEGNALEGIYLSNDDTSTYSCIFVQNMYFEANGDSGSGTNGVIYVVGNATPGRHKVVIEGCNFRGNPNNLSLKNISLDQAISYVGKNRISPQFIATTATCQTRFELNRSDDTTTDLFSYYKLLLGSVSVSDMNGAIGNGNSQVNLVASLTFPATAAPSVDPNTLDDYEEGTWTPTTAGFGGTVTSAAGEYTKIGNRVFFKITIQGTNLSAAALSTANCTLPFAVSSLSIAPIMDLSAQTNLGLVYVSTAGFAFFPVFGVIASPTLVVVGSYKTNA